MAEMILACVVIALMLGIGIAITAMFIGVAVLLWRSIMSDG